MAFQPMRTTRTARIFTTSLGIAVAQPAFAQTGILKTRSAPSTEWSPLAMITVGGGLEFETDKDETRLDAPLVLEFHPTETLQFNFETAVSHIDGKAQDVRTVTGFEDLETSVEYEFLRERRYTPALTAQGLIKWPTASDFDIGSPGTDYAIGLIASKDLVYFDLDLNLNYLFSGDPDQQDTLEVSLAGSYPLNSKIDLQAEIVYGIGADRWRGKTGEEGGPRAGGDETELTLGVAWSVNGDLAFEQGFTIRDDGSWQVLFSWQYSFGGN